ncbi:MAG TPA: MFS transporter [Anaerolineae bacterium]|nr:MFS transporter [Caldilineae bacterium]HID34362.1 MFS transporter [Anaerolineae bacterium]HIQ11724.1 MFS transporter [Caldilineales bacterium]
MGEALAAHRPVETSRQEVRSWAMYDWANSAFSTIVVTTLLGPYLSNLAQSAGSVQFLGFQFEPDAFFPTMVSASVVLQVIFLPILGAIADYSRLKKRLMLFFAFIGAIATLLLFFVTPDIAFLGTNGAVVMGGLLFVIANLSFGAAVVLYNAFLPDIAEPMERDQVSSYGWALGYLGGGIALAIALGLFTLMEDKGLAVRLGLALAGAWWLLFTLAFPARHLRQRPPLKKLPPGENYLSQGVKQILRTLKTIHRDYPETLKYLVAYLIYNDGIQTVIVVATLFAASELGAEADVLMILILMIQFIAFFGALAFGWLAQRIGAKKSILLSLVIWAGIVIYAYALLHQIWQLFLLGVFVALVMGGSQALSRSLFSQLIPRQNESEFFGFYEISERGTSWIGPLVFAAAVQFTGSSRVAILSIIAFFIIGLALLIPVNVRKAMLDAGNDPTGVII